MYTVYFQFGWHGISDDVSEEEFEEIIKFYDLHKNNFGKWSNDRGDVWAWKKEE